MRTTDLLTMAEIAHRSGFAPSAIRYYEALGLIAAHRAPSGHRRFERNVLRRLAFIRASTNVGMSLDDVRAAMDRLPSGRTPTKADWGRISAGWRGRLDERIRALMVLRDGLDSCIGCGCLSLRTCPLSNPDDVVADRGAGAAFLPRLLREPAHE